MPVQSGQWVPGMWVHGEAITNDAQNGAPVTLYQAGSTTETITLTEADQFVITDVILTTQVNGNVSLIIDVDADTSADAGELIVGGNVNLLGLMHSFITPYVCPAGTMPTLIAESSGAIMCVVHGYIRRAE
ncbi:hypothetical protein LCGC14_0095330 [marine sediment metagenome]|uniref:Uncharacterized protein n=1 Tax=marine sediment metagenome TaxID=412755 RepID=A0A0F9VEM5_9ZZZZ|nr:hypothetical protein [Phycisphaerae bacterium]HDZ45135.1 hypothetical protein [Phycisphaerae bacterium]